MSVELGVVVAPAAPAVGITGALLLLAFLWVVLYGLLRGYDYTFGAFLRELARSVEGIRWIGGRLADVLYSLDNRVRAAIATGLDQVEEGMAKLWAGLEWLAREFVDSMTAFAGDTYYAIENITESLIPAQVGAGVRPLKDSIRIFRDQLSKVVEQELARFRRGIDSLKRDVARDRLAAQRGIDYIGDLTIGNVIPRVRVLEHGLRDIVGYTRRTLARRLARVERYALGAAATAVAIAAVTRVFPYWQCTNVRRFNRLLCRSPIGLLDDLFGLALVLVGSLSIVELARALQPVTEFSSDAVTDWIVED